MANRLKMVQKELLFLLFSQDWSFRKISESTGLHRVTISRYHREWILNQKQTSEENPTNIASNSTSDLAIDNIQSVPLAPNKVPTEKVVHFSAKRIRLDGKVPTDPDSTNEHSSKSNAFVHHEAICEKLQLGQNAKSIYQDLVTDYGYTGSYDSVKRYVRTLKAQSPKLYARIETPAGEEAQVDFGVGAPTLKNGRYRKPWLFVMTLSCSRKSYEEVVWKQDVETFLRCHEHAFHFFGGVPKTVKVDNLKSAVLQAHLYEPDINPNYLAFAQHYHFVPLPCKVKTPWHKGKVESGVDYVQDNALTGKKFDSLDIQNSYLRNWNKTWASTRIHGTTKRQVNTMFEEERPKLQSLPHQPFLFFKIGTRKVNVVDSHIEVAGAYYPIPPQYMGKQVEVHYNSKWVKVFYRGDVIQLLSTVEKGRFHPDKSCLPQSKTWTQEKYVRHLFTKCAQIGSSVEEWAQHAESERQQRAYRSIQGIIALAKKYPHSTINQACQKSMDLHALSYHVVKNLADEIQIQKEIQIEIQFTQESDVIRSPLEYHHLLQEDTHGRTVV
jgi:transposase